MIHWPQWQDAMRFALAVSEQQVRKRVEGEGDMFEASGAFCFGSGVGHADEGDAVVFIVVGEEGEHGAFVDHAGAEEVLVVFFHGGVVVGAQHDVGEFAGRFDGGSGIIEVGGHLINLG